MTNLETLKQQTADLEAKLEETTEKLKSMKAEIERLENGWEMECPYVYGDKYFIVESGGRVGLCSWDGLYVEEEMFNQGHIFSTMEEAELEVKRRNLLTRFRSFRDECNGDWKPDFTIRDNKYFIEKRSGKIDVNYICTVNAFILFGYFKNEEDAKRAIELFGGEIKELFVEKRLVNE